MFVYFVAIWHILWPIGIFCEICHNFRAWVCCAKKNLAMRSDGMLSKIWASVMKHVHMYVCKFHDGHGGFPD
jgi:hypothetical protein